MKHGTVIGMAAAGWALCAAGFAMDRTQCFRSYLFAYVVFLQLALGCFALTMVHALTGGAWGESLRRPLAAGTGSLPWMALLFLPIAAGAHEIYPWAAWAGAGGLQGEARHAAAYLNIPFFLIRAAGYFLIWSVWALRLKARPGPALSASGLILYGLTAQFAAFDWCMSLEPGWHSTAYGFLFIASEAPPALALLILCATAGDGKDAGPLLAPSRLSDAGNLLLAFVLVWAYLFFMQFLIIWSGNLPDEIAWYARRGAGGWRWLAVSLAFLQFAAPLSLLLSRSVKRSSRLLRPLAALVLGAHAAGVFWSLAPAFGSAVFKIHGQDGACLLAVGATWYWIFARGYAAGNPLRRPAPSDAETSVSTALGTGHG